MIIHIKNLAKIQINSPILTWAGRADMNSLAISGILLLSLSIVPASSGQKGHIHTFKVNTFEILKNVPKIATLVEYVEVDADSDGLHREDIQQAVELNLRIAGIRIVDVTQPVPCLYTAIHTFKQKDTGIYAYDIEMSFQDYTGVWRYSNKHVPVYLSIPMGTIWHKSYIGCVGSNNIWTINENVKKLIDIFSNDYLKANPK